MWNLTRMSLLRILKRPDHIARTRLAKCDHLVRTQRQVLSIFVPQFHSMPSPRAAPGTSAKAQGPGQDHGPS